MWNFLLSFSGESFAKRFYIPLLNKDDTEAGFITLLKRFFNKFETNQ